MRALRELTLLLLLSQPTGAVTAADWQPYGPAAFDQAEKQDKLILLDLVAVWCHWCHVMESTTYRDAGVLEALSEHYVAVQADHDARPDLAERYRDYGWPATIVLTPDGRELVKRAGYIAPDEMAGLLRRTASIDRSEQHKPTRAAQTSAVSAALSPALRDALQQRHLDADDPASGGLRLMQKFLDADSIEWDLHLAANGDADAAQRARRHLDAALQLIDAEFGGAYQYSTHGDWAHPHYEKIMATQAAYLRAYSLAYHQFGDPRYRLAAEMVANWLNDFMRADNGGLFTSQDADLEQGSKAHDYFELPRDQRLARGLPRIDKSQYADANGKAIEGLVTLYQVTGQDKHLRLATRALEWVLRNRRRADGGFSHGADDKAGPYLSDNLYMGRAMLAVYEVSGQSVWLKQAVLAADIIDREFRHAPGGLLSAADNGTPIKPTPQLDQNIHAARFMYALASHTGEDRQRALADHVMRYLATPEVAVSRLTDAGILLADRDRIRNSKSNYSLTLIPRNKKGDQA
ncbi:DUF255 domain-containing protein [Thiosocius teredinicola]|uniref:DUF255 domain-containing protein n=1 Tax=Thiosocius teredinicola TaxID=1973002 RepID=UPI0009910E8A